MKIENSTVDPKTHSGSMRIIPNNSDDIYCLSSIILGGDKVSCYTTRKLSLDGGKTQKKLTLRLEIKVESTSSDLDNGIMYVKGKTSSEHEYVHVGSYHTLDITIGEVFTLWKGEWLSSDINKIRNCTKDVPEMCFIILYDKDCVISTVSSNAIKTIYKEEVKSKNYKKLVSNSLSLKSKVKNFVIASLSDARTDFYKSFIKEDSSVNKITTVLKLTPDYKGLPNTKVISKILSDKSMTSTFSTNQLIDDIREMQAFFLAMDSGKEDVCVGLKEVSKAMEYGAVKTFFVTDAFCKPKTVGERNFADGFIQMATELRARICIIPIALDLGERLDSIGGMERYKGDNGTVIVIGGSYMYTGAPIFTAKAALRSGADLVYIFSSEDAVTSIKGFHEAIVLPLEFIPRILDKATACVIGPGLGRGVTEEAQSIIVEIASYLDERNIYTIVDADAIHLYKEGLFNGLNLVIVTPSYKEARGLEVKKGHACIYKDKADAIEYNGSKTIVFNPSGLKRCGGQGDILCGILATAVSINPDDVIDACVSSCEFTRASSRHAFEQKGYSLITGDIVDAMPAVLKQIDEDDNGL